MEALIKSAIIIVSLVIMVFLALRFRGDNPDEFKVSVRPWGIGAAILLFFVMLGAVLSMGTVDAGHRGVVRNLGAVTDKTLGEGLYFVTPFVNTVEMMDVQTHAYEAPAAAASKDLQDVRTTVTLNYRLSPERVNIVFQTLRRDYLDRIVKPAVQESVKAITAQFNAEELIEKRPVVKIAIEEALGGRLAEHGIEVETVSITDFQFSASFTAAIEAKVVAVQSALESKNKLEQIKIEAEQVEAAAKGDANANKAIAEGEKIANITRAEGQAKALLTVANARAEANKTLNETLTDQVIQYELVQKLGDDIKVIVLPSGEQFILGPEVLGGK